jgi:hypothetical protein
VRPRRQLEKPGLNNALTTTKSAQATPNQQPNQQPNQNPNQQPSFDMNSLMAALRGVNPGGAYPSGPMGLGVNPNSPSLFQAKTCCLPKALQQSPSTLPSRADRRPITVLKLKLEESTTRMWITKVSGRLFHSFCRAYRMPPQSDLHCREALLS